MKKFLQKVLNALVTIWKKIVSMKKTNILKVARIVHIAVWTLIALVVIIGTCRVWEQNGCGAFSIIAAIAFYGACCTGLCVAGHLQFNEKIKETEEALKAQQKPQQPAAPAAPAEQPKRPRKQVF